MLQFTPITDEALDQDPALYLQLVPFDLDYPCRRLETEPEGCDDGTINHQAALASKALHWLVFRSVPDSPKSKR